MHAVQIQSYLRGIPRGEYFKLLVRRVRGDHAHAKRVQTRETRRSSSSLVYRGIVPLEFQRTKRSERFLLTEGNFDCTLSGRE